MDISPIWAPEFSRKNRGFHLALTCHERMTILSPGRINDNRVHESRGPSRLIRSSSSPPHSIAKKSTPWTRARRHGLRLEFKSSAQRCFPQFN